MKIHYKYFSILLFFICISCAFSQTLSDFLPGCPFIIDTTIIYVTPRGWQIAPTVAFGGTNYMIVWEDRRSDQLPYFYTDIHGGRVNPDGILLDSGGINICAAEGWQGSSSIAYGNGIYLVVWVDFRNYTDARNADIYGIRIDTAGQILDSESIIISNIRSGKAHPQVVFGETDFMVVWGDRRNGSSDIYGVRINLAGIVEDSAGIPIVTGPGDQFDPVLLCGKGTYMITWLERKDTLYNICCTFIKPSGDISTSNPISLASSNNEKQQPVAVFDGSNYFIVWQEPKDLAERRYYNVYGIRVDGEGHIIKKATMISSMDIGQPTIGLDNSGYIIALGGLGVKYVGLDTQLVKLKKSILSKIGFTPTIATNKNMNFLVWSYYDIYGVRINETGEIIDTNSIKISMEGNHQIAPAVASDGKNYLAVWQEYRDTTYDIYGIRLNQFGWPLDSQAIAISTACRDQRYPKVAFNGIDYLVVWEDGRESEQNYNIYGARVNRSGHVLDPDGFPINTAESQQWFPDIASDGTNFLVVWEGIRENSLDVFGARVTTAGKVLDPQGISITYLREHQRLPSIVYNGENYVVAWRDERDTTSIFQIYATLVNPSGKVLDTAGIFITVEGNKPSLARNGDTVLIVWEHFTKKQVYGLRINLKGKVLDLQGFPISEQNEVQNPVVTYSGNNYCVFWQEKRPGNKWRIAGAKISPDICSIEMINGYDSYFKQINPSITTTNTGIVFVLFSGFTEKIKRRPINVMRIWGELIPD